MMILLSSIRYQYVQIIRLIQASCMMSFVTTRILQCFQFVSSP